MESPRKGLVLSLDQVHAGYGGVSVLRGVSLEVPPSSVVALLGPNGAGKTTLLRVASGLIKPRGGNVQVGGIDVLGKPPHVWARHGVCHVPEGRGIFRSLSVKENLELASPPWLPRPSLEPALAIFPALQSRLSQTAGTLSGGEQQMLALARCFLVEPSVALLDEVSMGLAPRIVDEMFSSIRRLAEAGVALVVAEQYVRQALAIADYAYVLKHGEVQFEGPSTELDEARVEEMYLS